MLQPSHSITPLERDATKKLKLHFNEINSNTLEVVLYDPDMNAMPVSFLHTRLTLINKYSSLLCMNVFLSSLSTIALVRIYSKAKQNKRDFLFSLV